MSGSVSILLKTAILKRASPAEPPTCTKLARLKVSSFASFPSSDFALN
jgi:hypothetical protein